MNDSGGIHDAWKRRIRSKFAVVLAGVTLLGVVSVGAAGAGSAGATSSSRVNKHQAVVNLTWWTMWSGTTLTLLNKMVTAFNATHPGIHVTETNIPSDATTSTAKLLSTIAAGDPPDVFTEWWPEIGSFAADGDLVNMNQFLTGTYAGFEAYEYPVAVQAGTYQGGLYAVPMSLNSWALYYNKSLLTEFGIKHLPKTLAQLDADQAKMWTFSGKKIVTMGFYPDTDGNGFQFYTTFFGATNCITAAGKYDFASCPGAVAEMKWIASFDKYPYAQVMALQTALGEVAGGQTDIWTNGKSGFELSGPWVGAQNVPTSNPDLEGHFGVIAFPGIVGGPSTLGQGNFNIIPKGSAHPAEAFEFISWLAGYNNESFVGSIDPLGGWVPAGPSVTKTAPYQKWLKANSWLSGFLPEMTSKYTQAPVLTPTQAQLFTAENTATADVLQKIMTPMQALNYIDTQANASS
ncbi:MAG TPA: extracellular solute-binding protein [Acidimicrobiales bacterium]|nr:extracellular solute-binding protein [Acidimicrobiales bacterium]